MADSYPGRVVLFDENLSPDSSQIQRRDFNPRVGKEVMAPATALMYLIVFAAGCFIFAIGYRKNPNNARHIDETFSLWAIAEIAGMLAIVIGGGGALVGLFQAVISA